MAGDARALARTSRGISRPETRAKTRRRAGSKAWRGVGRRIEISVSAAIGDHSHARSIKTRDGLSTRREIKPVLRVMLRRISAEKALADYLAASVL